MQPKWQDVAPVIFKELGASCVDFKPELGKTCQDNFLQNWTCVGSHEWLISDEQKFYPWIMLSASSFEHTSHEEVTSHYPDTPAQNTNWLTFTHIQSPFPTPKAIQPLYPIISWNLALQGGGSETCSPISFLASLQIKFFLPQTSVSQDLVCCASDIWI